MRQKGIRTALRANLLSPEKILFTSESTGMQVTSMLVQTSPLKSYDDCFASAARLKAFDVNDLILPHYGRLPSFRNQTYFDDFIKEAELEQHMLEEAIRQGLSDDEAACSCTCGAIGVKSVTRRSRLQPMR